MKIKTCVLASLPVLVVMAHKSNDVLTKDSHLDDDKINQKKEIRQRQLQPNPAYEGRRQFSFALLGDGPYGEAAEAEYDNMIDHINSDVDLKFVVHIGDVKGGSELCSDELLTRRYEQFQGFAKPFLYTPGDNGTFLARSD